ncbi:hypothetical protein EV175_005718 [Coemansia sp. RSA 1933]|nr:hypothetical protein EV175_005718 [Coemansia sp. RSA 1933]
MGACNLYVPAKRRLAPTDPFFDLGNAEAGISHINKGLVFSRPLPHAQKSTDGDDSDMESLMDTELVFVESGILQNPIFCDTPPCQGSVAYPTPLAFERHYDQAHRNTCTTCSAIFPSSHWLDLHIQELHDAFFSARIARGDKAFQCFLQSCPDTFASPGRRKLHMIHAHQFPLLFDWTLMCNGSRPAVKDMCDRNADAAVEEGDSRCAMDVDHLATEFDRSVRVGVPKSISFGQQDT